MTAQKPEQLCTYLYGKVIAQYLKGTMVEVSIKDSSLKVSASDKGLPYVSINKRRLVVVRGSHIVAVFVRPRRRLFLKFGVGESITDPFLRSLRPKYFYK